MDQVGLILQEAQAEIVAHKERRFTGELSLILDLRYNDGGIQDCHLETRKRNRPAGARRR